MSETSQHKQSLLNINQIQNIFVTLQRERNVSIQLGFRNEIIDSAFEKYNTKERNDNKRGKNSPYQSSYSPTSSYHPTHQTLQRVTTPTSSKRVENSVTS